MDLRLTFSEASHAWKAKPEADKLNGSPEAKLINSTARIRLSPSACQSEGFADCVKGGRYS